MIAHPAALQTLIDSSPAHLFAVDRDYRYTAFNHSHARHTLEFYGTQIAIGSSSLEAITDPITRDRAHSALDRALGGEQFVELAVWPEIHLASLAVEMTLIPQLDSDGAVCGVCIKVQELSEVLYRSLFEDISAAILFVDAGSGAILDANPAACTFYGYSHAELTHLNIGDIMALAPDETRERIRRVADGEINQVLTHHRLANGEIREVDVTLGRRELNFSEWNAGRRGGSGEAAETIQRGSMPPAQYVLMHPSAALSAQEKQQLIQGLQQSLK